MAPGRSLRPVLCGLSLLLAFTVLVLCVMIESDGRDEGMYVAAGVLIQSHALYSEFAYMQMPYLPILYGIVYSMTGPGYRLLVGRLVSLGFTILAAWLLFLISRRVTRSLGIATSAVCLFILDESVLRTTGQAASYSPPVALSLLALVLVLPVIEGSGAVRWRSFLCGFLMAIATGVKLYYMVMAMAVAIGTLVLLPASTDRHRRRSIVASMSLGFAVGLAPTLWYCATRTEAFWFCNLGYHMVNARWREVTGYTIAMTLPGKLRLLLLILILWPSTLALVAAATLAWRNRRDSPLPAAGVMAALLTLASTATAFAPTPTSLAHFAAPLSFLAVFVGTVWRSPEVERNGCPTPLLLLTLVTWISGVMHLAQAGSLSPGSWPIIARHREGTELRRMLEPVRAGDRVATLSPVLALEAPLPVYPEFSSGPFLFRVGDLVPEQLLDGVTGLSPSGAARFLERERPRAVIVGREGEIEAPLRQFAEKHRYRRHQLGSATVYVRPD